VGSDEQRQRWLSALASGQLIAAFALTEPELAATLKTLPPAIPEMAMIFW